MDTEIEVDIDDELLAAAREYTGLTDVQAVVTAALKAFIELETQRRARFGISES
jgi:Arc/MetJ family transcription regulator